MLNAGIRSHILDFCAARGKVKPKNLKVRKSHSKGLVFFFIVVSLSGVCFMTYCQNRPIFAREQEAAQTENMEAYKFIRWRRKISGKYQKYKISYPAQGIAHIKTVKYINKKPVKVNIVEIAPDVNKNIVIKPQIAGQTLNARAKIKNIANKESAIMAVNAGFFKPQTGTPLGILMINNRILTGPIYERVALGISQDGEKTKFEMGRLKLGIKISNENVSFKADNINQPRMLSSYTLIYDDSWGEYSPAAPKYGVNAVVEKGRITLLSANPVRIPKDGYVISAQINKIKPLLKQENLTLEFNLPDKFKESNHIIGGGPYLVKNGNIFVDIEDEKLTSIGGKNPRSAVGYTEDNSLIIVTVDGREASSVGMTLTQLANLMKNLGCKNAMNLDGGSSTVLFLKGIIANNPQNTGGIPISNALTVFETNSIKLSEYHKN